MARKRGRKKRDFTEILLVILTVLVLLAVFAVVLAVIYPEAASDIVADSSRSFERDQRGPSALLRAVGRRATEGYQARLGPAFRYIADTFTSLFSGRETKEKKENVPKLGPRFAANRCQTACHEHEDLFDRRAFGNLYIDHRLHDAAEVECRECHFDIGHEPRPGKVRQSTCLDCHRKVKATTECEDCHAPGSLMDKDRLAGAKTNEFLSGSTARTKSLVPHRFGSPDPVWLKGQGDVPCRNCHVVPEFCNKCHLAFHVNLPDWLKVHGPRILGQEYDPIACWQCHSANWCAGNCHLNEGQSRSGQYLPVPRKALDTQ